MFRLCSAFPFVSFEKDTTWGLHFLPQKSWGASPQRTWPRFLGQPIPWARPSPRARCTGNTQDRSSHHTHGHPSSTTNPQVSNREHPTFQQGADLLKTPMTREQTAAPAGMASPCAPGDGVPARPRSQAAPASAPPARRLQPPSPARGSRAAHPALRAPTSSGAMQPQRQNAPAASQLPRQSASTKHGRQDTDEALRAGRSLIMAEGRRMARIRHG